MISFRVKESIVTAEARSRLVAYGATIADGFINFQSPNAEIARGLITAGNQKTGIKKIMHGVSGLAKAAIGADKADKSEIKRRREICQGTETTPRCQLWNPKLNTCRACTCFLPAKIRIKSEHCPINRW